MMSSAVMTSPVASLVASSATSAPSSSRRGAEKSRVNDRAGTSSMGTASGASSFVSLRYGVSSG